MPEQTQPVGVLVKTAEVLRALANSEAPLGPTEIGAITGIDRSAVHRILTTLARERLVERADPSGSYRLGLGLAALGLVAANRLDLRRAARPQLEALFARFSETVNLGVPDGDTVLYVDMLESKFSLRMAAEIGSRDALATTALGKSILAYQPEDRLDAVLAHLSLLPRTPRSIRTPDALRRELAKVRKQGFALDDEENELGAYCVGAPIFGLTREVVGAVSISVPTVRLDDSRRVEMIEAVVEAARRVSGDLDLVATDERRPVDTVLFSP
ncbi:MAG: IclR family transcriptional regulator, acetate operon repressor [Thermomicrobiales bacterium]|jgi:IclR family acetate operon transcriptional repressor|nr:IclR family transcriptional regulator, acetate operon repressor [Thermomicrobiales bacterium]MEA2596426.1 IclR family transcriptional regulator, acetate operon repressor [Thermomicrobiales bacterium]